MMNLSRVTSDGLIKAAVQRSKIDNSDPDTLLEKVIADMDAEADPETVKNKGYTNAIRDGIERLKRITIQEEKTFETCGQTDLFGSEILEHKVPKRMLHETVAEVDRWMQQRAEIELANADEFDRVAVAQRERAVRFKGWALQTQRVRAAVLAAGYDPEVMLYGEAFKKT